MRGQSSHQQAMFCYVDLESRVPGNHPIHKIRCIVDEALAELRAAIRTDVLGQRPTIDSPRTVGPSVAIADPVFDSLGTSVDEANQP